MNLDNFKALGKEEILHMLGMEARRDTGTVVASALAVFGLGVVVGAGVGLLLAPRTGRELRKDIGQRIRHAPEAVAALPQQMTDAVQRATAKASAALHENGNIPADHRP